MNEPTHLDLFSGIGGFALAAQWAGFRTIGFCEIDSYCRKVLAKNFLADTAGERVHGINGNSTRTGIQRSEGKQEFDGTRPRIHSDIFDLNGHDFAGVSLITGGFPCQPFSVAGKRRGAADDRAIWPEMFRVISEARPAWVLGENVPGIIPMELDNVLSDLEGIGYATRSFVIPACAVDARHRRDRVWIVANRNSVGEGERHDGNTERGNVAEIREGRNCEDSQDASTDTHNSNQTICNAASEGLPNGAGVSLGTTGELQPQPERSGGSVPDAEEQGLEGQREIAGGTGAQLNDSGDHCRWLPEPDVGRVAHGIPSRVDRLKGLGNAIVPQVAFQILRVIYDVWTKEKTNVHAAH